MLSLGAVKDGVILPSEEDRKRIITQMKVRTTLRGDNSWIQQRSNGEEEQQRSPLRSPVRSRGTNGRSPVSPRKFSPIRRTTSVESPTQNEPQPSSPKSPPTKSPSATQPPGYLIRGVFTKTIDKTGPLNTASNGSPKSAKVASLPRTSPGYKLSTEEYKKLAPYNVKRESAEPYEANRTVSVDEQKKRTEAASSVLRRTAGKERSYVFSAAKKSSGSPSQDTPSFVAKRVDLEDDIGPRSRSQTVPASGWFGSRVKSIANGEKRSISESPWGEPRMTNAASNTSIDTGCRSQAPKPSSESSPASNRFSSPESRGPDDQKSELPSHSGHAQKVPSSPTKSSENRGKVSLAQGTEKRGVVFSEDSYKAKPKSVMEMPPSPRITITPESSPNSGYYRISDAGTGVETHHRPKAGEYMSDRGADVPRSALDQKEGNSFSNVKHGSPNTQVPEFSEHQPVTARDSMNAISGERYGAPIRTSADEDVGASRSFSGLERKTTQEAGYESQSDTEYKKVEAHLAKTGSSSSESSLSLLDISLRDYKKGIQKDVSGLRDEPELDTTRSSSISTGSGMATPESQQGEYGSDSDSASRSYFPFRDNNATASPKSHRVPFYKDSCEPEVGRGLLFVKESVNSTELSSSPRYNSRSLVDLSNLERSTYSSATSLNSVPPKRSFEEICTYCGREIRNCAKITIENLKICCHEYCFRCGICHKPMGDLLDKIFIHRDIVHCDKCYEKLF